MNKHFHWLLPEVHKLYQLFTVHVKIHVGLVVKFVEFSKNCSSFLNFYYWWF